MGAGGGGGGGGWGRFNIRHEKHRMAWHVFENPHWIENTCTSNRLCDLADWSRYCPYMFESDIFSLGVNPIFWSYRCNIDLKHI